ncbi:MAG: hypothetical protein KDM91_00715 [Verrucomicrobiae bacterium]|nr:hypothetical protein [Verrucomicrobiae bacterium]
MNRQPLFRFVLQVAAVAGGTLFPGAAFSQAPAAGGPVTVDRAVDVVAKWAPDRHLYVKGSLGLPPAKLAELETWLDARAPNWTVVLTQNAAGETFRDAGGRAYSGMDAVDHALGKSLANTTAFGELTDARTGERNGAFFILYLQERKFTYYGSDVFDKRDLGESRWIGRLDQPAIRAMRGGGRIADAVKDTIESIEGQLTRKIESEKNAARLAAIRKQEALTENGESLRALGAEIGALEKTVADYRRLHPAAAGDLVSPDIAAWRAGLESALALTGRGEVDEPARTIRKLREATAGFRESFALLGKAPAEIAKLEERISSVEPVPDLPAAEGLRAQAREALASARENFEKADSLCLNQLTAGHAALDEADRAVLAWQRALAAERKRREMLRTLWRGGLALAALLAAAGLAVASRLRRPLKAEAEKALAGWREKLSGRFEALFQLMDRAALVVGTGSSLRERGYSGVTLDLGRETIRSVDELFIMSSAADKVMGMAAAAIEPGGVFGRLANAFSSRRYRRGLRTLDSDAIGFDREEGLEAILMPRRGGKEGLLGEAADYEPFRMTFSDLVSAYDEKQASAAATLERVGGCLDGLPVRLEAVRGDLRRLHERAAKLDREAAIDGHFSVDPLEGALAAAAEDALDEAASLGKTDPVAAHEGPAARAARLLAEGLRLADRIDRWRADEKPAVEEALDFLRQNGRRTVWIADVFAGLAEAARRTIEASVAGPAGEALDAFDGELTETGARVAEIVVQTRRAVSETGPAIENTGTSVENERRTLASKLSCDPAALFEEGDGRPADFLDEARRDLAAAFAALDRGRVAAARGSLDEVDAGLSTVDAILRESAAVFENFSQRDAEAEKAAAESEARIGAAADRVETMRSGYDSAVLRFASRLPAGAGEEEGTVDETLAVARERFAEGRAAHAGARAAREALRPLEAGRSLDLAGIAFAAADEESAAIEGHFAALTGAENENPDAWRAADARHRDRGDDVSDRRTRRPTIEEWEAIRRELDALAAEMERDHPNPFAGRAGLAELDARLAALGDAVVSDWDLHAMAAATLAAAGGHLEKLEARVRRSQTDNIPDSPGVAAISVKFGEYRDALAAWEARLGEAHGDWEAAERGVSAVSSAILVTVSELERELERGEACAAALNGAVEKVRQVKDWRSRHRVEIDRDAGVNAYRLAYEAFSAGDYDEAARLASRALEEARQAVRQAAFEEERARDRERQAAALAASRVRRSSHSSFGGGGSFGGSRSSFGGGSSRSSFSSGSGTSRSGW